MSKGSHLLGGGIPGPRLRGADRCRRLAFARAWHIQMKPIFDEMAAHGLFLDSPPRLAPFARRPER